MSKAIFPLFYVPLRTRHSPLLSAVARTHEYARHALRLSEVKAIKDGGCLTANRFSEGKLGRPCVRRVRGSF